MKSLLRSSILSILMFSASAAALAQSTDPEVLVTIGSEKVYANQLEQAVSSSPFATQFVAMDEDQQASLRGDLLKRLVASRLLTLEARKQGLDKSEDFIKDVEAFRNGLLYRFYMDKLREKVVVPDDVLAQWKEEFKGDADALDAARSAYIKDRYRAIRVLSIQNLKEKYHVKLHEERLKGAAMDTVLLEGDGLKITYADLIRGKGLNGATEINEEWLKDQLYNKAELAVIAKAAEKEAVDVANKVEGYQAERLPAMLLEQKAKEWVGDEAAQRAYYEAHPQMSEVPARLHIGQLVTKTRAEAEQYLKQIKDGESLFVLAGKYSIDPYGKSRNGDIGWVTQGSGNPAIEAAIKDLGDQEISEIVETPRGFHIVTILERRPGGKRSFEGIRDRVQQAMISEKLVDYVNGLEKDYKVVWNVIQEPK